MLPVLFFFRYWAPEYTYQSCGRMVKQTRVCKSWCGFELADGGGEKKTMYVEHSPAER